MNTEEMMVQLFEMSDMYGTERSKRIATDLVSSREFSPVAADPAQVASRAEMMAKLASIPDEELDTLIITAMVKGDPVKCDACDEDHFPLKNVTMCIGDHPTLVSMLHILLAHFKGTAGRSVGTADNPEVRTIADLLGNPTASRH